MILGYSWLQGANARRMPKAWQQFVKAEYKNRCRETGITFAGSHRRGGDGEYEYNLSGGRT
jgi:hypothetical protein